MELIGRKIERGNTNTGIAEVTFNPVNGGIKFSKWAVETLRLNGAQIGFAYDEDISGKIYLFKMPEDEIGIKVSATGSASNRYHSRRLMTAFEQNGGGKYTLVIDTNAHTEEGYDMDFYSLAIKNEVDTEDTVTTEAKAEAKESVSMYQEVEIEETILEEYPVFSDETQNPAVDGQTPTKMPEKEEWEKNWRDANF